MSELACVNQEMRIAAIRILLKNHPVLQENMITENEDFNSKATPEALDFDEPADTLVRLAWDIWNGGGETELDTVLNQLRQPDFVAFIEAMQAYSALREKVHFFYASGAEDD